MPTREHPRIFISYARSDGRAFAQELRRRLVQEHSFAVWQDLSEMEGGKDWWLQIEAAIRHPDLEYLVLVITENSLRSEVVRDEWRLARQEGKCVIPVIGAEAVKTRIGSLPGWMQAAHFVDTGQPEQWQTFIRTLESRCEQPRVPMMAPRPPADFIPRPEQFEALRSLLVTEADGQRVSITAALKGAGGYGKTTLAKALCHDDAVQQRFHHGILWVTLGETPDLIKQILDLIEVLTGARPGYQDLGAASARLAELLANHAYLLVIDDVWKRAHLDPFLRGGPQVRVAHHHAQQRHAAAGKQTGSGGRNEKRRSGEPAQSGTTAG